MITVAERRRLEKVIDAHRDATTAWVATRATGGDAAEQQELWRATYQELRDYLDELTDYSKLEPTRAADGLSQLGQEVGT